MGVFSFRNEGPWVVVVVKFFFGDSEGFSPMFDALFVYNPPVFHVLQLGPEDKIVDVVVLHLCMK